MVNSQDLRRFLHRSREWSRVNRGLELFEQAALDLKELGGVDAGFFIYRKRVFDKGVTSQSPTVYAPWGIFENQHAHLQTLVQENTGNYRQVGKLEEKWVKLDDTFQTLQRQWDPLGVKEVGLWSLVSREQRIGALVAVRTTAPPYPSKDTRSAILDACAAQVSLALDLILLAKIAEEASQQDLLTGVFNRRGLESRIADHVKQCQHHGKHPIVVVLDLDHLKQINDHFGHPAGDQALRDVARILEAQTRAEDVIARIGGDEFVVLSSSSDSSHQPLVDRLNEAIRNDSPGYTASIGGAVWDIDGNSWDTCYQAADARLYENKRQQPALLRLLKP